ncbi:hypothetical protein THERMOS_1575 [Bathymodiolus thermophilus thioautotrophic gill symbiont]|uniref:Uncharacterized protein n=1 Tax=Bathymodiolus thermophilus thioautotrophic gill symbiont TaxID=2360 RepID=A0A8H9CGD8_9GAMM|nr:hypothetical protein THERMOS_1575 [Bathymodiolus thermophilus thioautotrophic gill symbiont]
MSDGLGVMLALLPVIVAVRLFCRHKHLLRYSKCYLYWQ